MGVAQIMQSDTSHPGATDEVDERRAEVPRSNWVAVRYCEDEVMILVCRAEREPFLGLRRPVRFEDRDERRREFHVTALAVLRGLEREAIRAYR